MKFKEMLESDNKSELNEAGHSEELVADAFTRFLLGDRNAALKLLEKMKNVKLSTNIEPDSAEYNKQYDRVYKEFTRVVKRG